ncbi:MAG: branched-chain amino acid ABC transporter substrate-binding protein [Rhodospirillaceae bacterium]|nr:branched-chain amino acid ABC transporter substrate-binding protein [Rhodospirillaceae bacterium]MYB13519.1 branched-chain amino acid ABC transporter substrate-binding protein [Rhodospirillaceae bacterium]MYG50969.1 branched-chain amino acid ABC transporter substrate-binding protein [Rhodospirillaceae bacterium]MYI49857.1 branched-chain amino acid ABC transporter substrate-binding protein [Rhodospirillaceae bacterium]
MTRLKFSFAAAAAASVLAFSPAQAELVIATVGPMTGQYASFGEQMRRGAEQAVKDLNAAGGVLGQKVKLEIGDDACDPKQAVAVAKKLVSQKVVFVGGHFCSGSSIPASKVYTAGRVLQISPASTNPKLTDEGGPNVFRVCGRDDQQGVVAGTFLHKNYPGKKVAFLHDKTAYGKGLMDATLENYQKAGGKAAMVEAYTAGEKDYTALVSKMKAAGIDVFYLGGYHTEGALMIRQAHEMGYKPQLVSGDALVTDEFWKIAGNAGEGVLMTFSPDPRKNAVAAPVVAKFKAQKYEPEGYTLYTYGAIQAWAAAVTKAGSTDLAKVVKVLRSEQFDTVLGKIGFDKKGDVTAPGYVWYVWSKGTYDYAK